MSYTVGIYKYGERRKKACRVSRPALCGSRPLDPVPANPLASFASPLFFLTFWRQRYVVLPRSSSSLAIISAVPQAPLIPGWRSFFSTSHPSAISKEKLRSAVWWRPCGYPGSSSRPHSGHPADVVGIVDMLWIRSGCGPGLLIS